MSDTRERLLTWLDQLGFAREVPFRGLNGKRRFRFDAAHEGKRVAIDYQGIGRGHRWHEQQATDHEKASEAALCGWTLLLCDAISVNNGRCLQYIEKALEVDGQQR